MVTCKTAASVQRHDINATFSDVIVTFTIFSDSADIYACNELEFIIEAVGKPLLDPLNRGETLRSYTTYGGYLPSNLIKQTLIIILQLFNNINNNNYRSDINPFY